MSRPFIHVSPDFIDLTDPNKRALELNQRADLGEHARKLEAMLRDAEIVPERDTSIFTFKSIREPFYIPDFIKSYIDIGMHLGDISVAIDISDVGVFLHVDIVCQHEDQKITLRIENSDDSEIYQVTTDTGKSNPTECDPNIINRFITELALKPADRIQLATASELDPSFSYPDVRNIANARLLRNSLAQNAVGVSSSSQYDFDHSDLNVELDISTTSEFADSKTLTLRVKGASEDGPVVRILNYELAISRHTDPLSSKAEYDIAIEADRALYEDGTLVESLNDVPDASVIEHSIGVLKNISSSVRK